MTAQLSDCCKATINSNNNWEHRHECSNCGRHIGTPLDETEKEIKQISDQQRKALHLLFAFVAKEYENAGYDLHKLLTEFPAVHVPVQTKHIKEIWRAAQIEQTGIESTENAGNHIDTVYETFNRYVAQAGIHVPFPSLESLYKKSRKDIGL